MEYIFGFLIMLLAGLGALILHDQVKKLLQFYKRGTPVASTCSDLQWQQYPATSLLHNQIDKKIYQQFAKTLRNSVNAGGCWIIEVRYHQEFATHYFRIRATDTLLLKTTPQESRETLFLRGSLLHKVIENKNALFIKDSTAKDAFFRVLYPNLSSVSHILAIPILVLNEIQGIVILAHRQTPFRSKDLQRLSACLQSLSAFMDYHQVMEMLGKTEAELHYSEKKFEAIFAQHPFPLAIFDQNGEFVHANPVFSQTILGGERFPEGLHVETIEFFQKYKAEVFHCFNRALLEGLSEGECILPPARDNLNHTLAQHWHYRFIRIPFFEQFFILMECQDVSHRTKAERYQYLFEKIFYHVPIGLCLLNDEAQIVLMNNFLEIQLLGNPKDIKKRSLPELLGIRNWSLAYPHPIELTLNLPWLSYPKTVLLFTQPLEDIKLHLLVFTDITEQKNHAKQLLHLAKMENMGLFASGLAHDFNNIMTIIHGNLQWLCEEYAHQNPEQQSMLEDTISAVEEGKMLIQRLMRFARGYDDELTVHNIHDVLEALRMLLTRIIAKEAHLSWKVESALRDYQANLNLSCFDNTLANLFINARDAIRNKWRERKDAGHLYFAAQIVSSDKPILTYKQELPAGTYLQLRIQDNGTGIDSAMLQHIFEPFYTTKKSGSGLGLASAYQCMRKMQGGICVQSKPGAWTLFTLYLPIWKESKE